MSSGPADTSLDLFKSLVFDELMKVAASRIVGLAPFLSFGPFAYLINAVVTYVGGILYELLKETVNFNYILINNEILHRRYVNAVKDIKSVASLKGIDSPEFKTAREAHKEALSKFVRYSGSVGVLPR